MASTQLRNMSVSDLPAVNRVLSKAFTAARIEEGHQRAYVPPVHLPFLEMYLSNFPPGCFVMEQKRSLIGYGFTHLWGKVGWIGPISIIPSHQGNHHGREIMEAIMRVLNEAGARVIGLETTPRNYRNIGFYSKLGFVPEQLTLDLIKRVPPLPGEPLAAKYEVVFFNAASDSDRQALMAGMEQLAAEVDPHLSLRTEVEMAAKYKFGDALCVLKDNRLVACALGHTEAYSTQEPPRYLKIILMLAVPKQDVRVSRILPLLFDWAARKNLDTISVRIPTRYYRAYRLLIAAGFRVLHSELRMTLRGHREVADPRKFYLSKWE